MMLKNTKLNSGNLYLSKIYNENINFEQYDSLKYAENNIIIKEIEFSYLTNYNEKSLFSKNINKNKLFEFYEYNFKFMDTDTDKHIFPRNDFIISNNSYFNGNTIYDGKILNDKMSITHFSNCKKNKNLIYYLNHLSNTNKFIYYKEYENNPEILKSRCNDFYKKMDTFLKETNIKNYSLINNCKPIVIYNDNFGNTEYLKYYFNNVSIKEI